MKTPKEQQVVYVGMSGGVDSSVSAALLLQAGYKVVGVYMKNWTEDFEGTICAWRDDLADARAVAAKLGISLVIYDFQKEYKSKVVDYMISEYQAGRTPNPDIMCNQEIKFKLFFDAAMADGADRIATGHYAKTKNGRLYKAADQTKDQTYFLYRASAKALAKTLFPLGDYTKTEVREMAHDMGLVTASKPDSVGICFVGEIGMKTFLSKYVRTNPGDIILQRTGELLGPHEGAIYYTIGQRQGLGVGGNGPYFVTGKNVELNQVFVTDNASDLILQTRELVLIDSCWQGRPPHVGEQIDVRIRHLGQLYPAKIKRIDGSNVVISTEDMIKAASPGQSAVVYSGEEVLGGGIIAAA